MGEADVDALFDQMCADLYGPAGPAIREYYRLMEDAMAVMQEHFPGGGTAAGARLFNEELLAQLTAQFTRAHELADSDLIRRRLAKLDLSLQYTVRLTDYVRARNAIQTKADGERAVAMLEAIVEDIRGDRDVWDGVVSTSVVAQRTYLGKELTWLRERVENMQ